MALTHPLTGGPTGAGRCGDCAWRVEAGPGPRRPRCLQHKSDRIAPRVDDAWPGCDRYEPPFGEEACGACGACCHRGFHRVELGPREPAHRVHGLAVRDAWGLHMPRPNGVCVALRGGDGAPWRCTIYADRPRACADFPVRSEACRDARRRVGYREPG